MFIYNWLPSCICYFTIANFSPEFIYLIFITSCTTRSTYLYCRPGSINELIFYSRGLDHPGRTKGSSSEWSHSHHLAFGLLRRSIGRTARFMEFIANQLVRLFGAHFYSALTSSPTSWLSCSVLDSSSIRWSNCSSLHRQLRWGSPAKLGTPRRSNSLCKCYQLS
jgi:hypothetical protein